MEVTHDSAKYHFDAVRHAPGAVPQATERLLGFGAAGVASFIPQIGWPYDQGTIDRLIGEVGPAIADATGR